MENQKKRMMAVPVLVLALAPVACGTLSPTSPDDMSAASGAAPSTVAAAGLKKPTRVPPPACTAQALVLSTDKGNPTRITATFVNTLARQGFSADCDTITWSVSPVGAHVVPVAAGTADARVVDLVVTGANQTYTVSAFSATLSASIDVTPGGASNDAPKLGGLGKRPGGTKTRVCLAEGITLSIAKENPGRVYAFLTDSVGLPVSTAGCSMTWSASPDGAFMQPVSLGTADALAADLVVVGARQAYTVKAATNGLVATIDVDVTSAGTPR